jgi:hypothetical protein
MLKPVPLGVTQVLDEAKGRPARWQDCCLQLLVVEALDDRQRSGSLRIEEVLQHTRLGDHPRLGHGRSRSLIVMARRSALSTPYAELHRCA